MSYVAQRAVLDTRARVRDLTGIAPSLLTTGVMVGLAVLLSLQWFQRGAALPAAWQLPPAETLFLLPGAPVIGLLALRVLVGGRNRSVASQHLMTMAGRWAGLWAAVTAVWVVLTVAGLYGVPVTQLAMADNLVAVVAASDAAVGQLTVLWVSLLVALFADRLGNWRETIGLAALAGAAVLSALPQPAAGHGHAGTDLPLVLTTAALELVAVAIWLGAMVAVPHLRTPAYQLRYHLTRFGGLVTGAVVVLGVSGVLAGLLLPATNGATPPALAVGQFAAIALVAAAGYRHRRRSVEVMTTNHGLALLALVAGELIVMGAVVMVGFVLPVAG